MEWWAGMGGLLRKLEAQSSRPAIGTALLGLKNSPEPSLSVCLPLSRTSRLPPLFVLSHSLLVTRT